MYDNSMLRNYFSYIIKQKIYIAIYSKRISLSKYNQYKKFT